MARLAEVDAAVALSTFLTDRSDSSRREAAQKLLHTETVSDGFTVLWEKGRLDLSVEALVMQERFNALLTDDDRKIARARLAQYGYRSRSG